MENRSFTYYYTTNAVGLGGVLKHPDGATTIIPSLASVVLPSTGGEGFNEVMNYNQGGVSFSNARSSVLGYDSDYRTFTTRADAYITNLNLFGRIKADILQTSISSTREVREELDMEVETNPDNVRFSMQAMIRGLTIDGVEVIPELDLELCECRTYEQFAARIGTDSAGTDTRQLDGETEEQQTTLTATARPLLASCFRAIRHQPSDRFGQCDGFKLPVKDLGNVYFGELIVKPGSRHVNLLRIEFNSPYAFSKSAYAQGEALVAEPVFKVTSSVTGGAETNADATENVTAAAVTAPTYDGGSMTLLSHDSNGVPIWPTP
jgi:hypothetical protein